MKQHPTLFETAEENADFGRATEALSEAKRVSFWLDDLGYPADAPSLDRNTDTDLLVVGGGYAGLWSALRSKERYPERDVVLIEAERIAWAASGRNGGFCEPSLTHGRSNAAIHLPKEKELLEQMGEQNLEELLETIKRYDIDCDIRPHGVIKLATEPHQEETLASLAASDSTIKLLEGDALQEQVRTPAARVGGWATAEGVVLNPVALARGLYNACVKLGVRVYEHTTATEIEEIRAGRGVIVSTPRARIVARHVVLATNGFNSLLKRDSLHTVPVYDYAIVTEPLTVEQRESLGWQLEQGLTTMNSRFHYFRLLTDAEGRERILFGGYDALYHFGRKVKPEYDVSEPTFRRLVVHLETMFPQLTGIKITHAWGGMIDTCSRFFSFFTRSYHDQVVSAKGFTGLGVAATRFAGDVMLDLLNGVENERTRTGLVRKQPMPFPPEPFVWPAITFTAKMMARSDRRAGKQGLWLWLLGKLKMGFDS